MKVSDYTYLLEHTSDITADHTSELRNVIDAFPFFQSAHALYLKGLKNQGSFTYNGALKTTAAHTTDRSVLFEYITSNVFIQNAASERIKDQEDRLRQIRINDSNDLSLQVEQEEQEKASKILDPTLFVEKENSVMTTPPPEKTLQIGTPLSFTKSESYSFGEWLKLSSLTPIKRERDVVLNDQKEIVLKKPLSPEISTQAENQSQAQITKERKQKIVDSFIESNPKIVIKTTQTSSKSQFIKEEDFTSDSLMTETLAKVYVEQKNYKKAKQAFRILSLKYPEKSGFFADQIRAVEQLEEQKG